MQITRGGRVEYLPLCSQTKHKQQVHEMPTIVKKAATLEPDAAKRSDNEVVYHVSDRWRGVTVVNPSPHFKGFCPKSMKKVPLDPEELEAQLMPHQTILAEGASTNKRDVRVMASLAIFKRKDSRKSLAGRNHCSNLLKALTRDTEDPSLHSLTSDMLHKKKIVARKLTCPLCLAIHHLLLLNCLLIFAANTALSTQSDITHKHTCPSWSMKTSA